MTYSNDDIKKYGFAVIDGTVYQHFENEGWKNVAAVMEVDRYEADSYGFPVPVMDINSSGDSIGPPTLDPTAEMFSPIINFTPTDSSGNSITWSMSQEGKVGSIGRISTIVDGNTTTIIPRRRKSTPSKNQVNDDLGREQHLRFTTNTAPDFYYGEGEHPPECIFDSNGQKSYNPPLNFKMIYDGTSFVVADYNHRKIFDLISLGVPKINYYRTTPSGFDRPSGGTTALEFSSTGNNLFLLSSNKATGYDMASPYNIGTAGTDTPTPYNFSPNNIQSGNGIVVNSNGTLMLVLDTNTKKVYEFDIDTPNAIDTTQFRANFYNNIYSEVGFKTKLSSDGKHMYTLCHATYGGQYTDIYTSLKRFTLTENNRVSTSTYRNDQSFNLVNDRDYYVFGGYPNWTERNIRGAVYTYSFQFPYGRRGKYYDHYGPVRDFFMNDSGNQFFTISTAASITGEIRKYQLSDPYRISNMSHQQTINHFIGSTAAEDFERNQKINGPHGIAFNKDGTRMFILDTFTKSVMQYNLSIGYDLGSINTFNQVAGVDKTIDPDIGHDGQLLLTDIPSTASTPPSNLTPNHPDDVTFNQSVFQDFSLIRSMQFNGMGSRLFVSNDHKIYEYTMTTNFDITTATFNRSFSTYQTSLENKDGCGNFHFDSNAGQLYISSKNIIEQFKLDSNIGTGSDEFGTKVLTLPNDSNSITSPRDMYLNDTNDRLYISGEDRIIKYNLPTPGKLTGATFADSFQSYDSLQLSGAGLTLNDSENKFYMVGSASDDKRIYEFTLDSNMKNSTYTNREYSLQSVNSNSNIVGIRWNPNGQEFTVTGQRKEETYKTKNKFKIQTL